MASYQCSGLHIPHPNIPNASVDFLKAHMVFNKSSFIPESAYVNHGPVNVTNVSYCVVSVTYTHTHQTDLINTQVWLPVDNWNGRLMGLGGGGFWCGLYPANMMVMLGVVGEGYAAVSTDCGHTMRQNLDDWLLKSPGEIDVQLLDEFAGVSLNEAAFIGKSVAESFYGAYPDHSYFSGCSQGGRQAMMLAQRYPDAYDGIVASAPATNWAELLLCELDHLTNSAIHSCDDLDGVHDDIVSDIDACKFDAYDMIGMDILCGEQTVRLSEAAAIVATAAWQGPVFRNDKYLWTGVDIVSNLTSSCGLPVRYSSDWIRLAVLKDPKADLHDMSHDGFVQIFSQSVQEYNSVIGTRNPNLTEFAHRGGKILSFHLGSSHQISDRADPMIPSRGTRRYYESVAAIDPSVRRYYRLFEAPGLGHCWSSSGLYPSTIFDDMVDWVERGQAPDYLPASFTDEDGVEQSRILCPYPERAVYNKSGDSTSRSSYFCNAEEPDFRSIIRPND
ncbi:Tannase/feruloyl esterase [Aspergillus crustosus]